MTEIPAPNLIQVFKPPPVEVMPSATTWWKTILSLLVYVAVYLAIFRDFGHVLLLVMVILIHEGGHYFAMKIFGYRDIRLFFIPLIGAFVSGQSGKASPYQRSLMILAGPLPGIFIGLVLFSIYMLNQNELIFESSMLFLLLNAFNLIPMSPLDGGQLMQTLYFGSNYTVQALFILVSIFLLGWLSVFTGNYFLLVIVAYLCFRLKKMYDLFSLRNNVIKEGAGLKGDYDSLSDADYLSIRNVLLKLFPEWDNREMTEDAKEQEIAALIQMLLQHNPSQPLLMQQKIYLTFLWLCGLMIPVLAAVYYFIFLQ